MNKTISVITITYNDPEGLKRTGDSIAMQANCNLDEIEWIIINGNPDNKETIELIENFKDIGLVSPKSVSEPDRGIYDAMNKGMKRATGKYQWYMNSGDIIAKEDTVDLLLGAIQRNPEADFIYGDFYYKDKYRYATKDAACKRGYMASCHQAILFETATMQPYDETFKISADHKATIQAYARSKKRLYINEPLAKYQGGGISDRKHVLGTIEGYRARKESGVVSARHNLQLTGAYTVKSILKTVFPTFYETGLDIFKHYIMERHPENNKPVTTHSTFAVPANAH